MTSPKIDKCHSSELQSLVWTLYTVKCHWKYRLIIIKAKGLRGLCNISRK